MPALLVVPAPSTGLRTLLTRGPVNEAGPEEAENSESGDAIHNVGGRRHASHNHARARRLPVEGASAHNFACHLCVSQAVRPSPSHNAVLCAGTHVPLRC
jgi:hypothetical protein